MLQVGDRIDKWISILLAQLDIMDRCDVLFKEE